ncbi:MAG: AlkA N-terminal domain-containing protein, partial [Gammaproteobacteria bacterium]
MDAVKRVANAAVARIDAGALTHLSVDELATEFGVGARQLHRVIETEFGVSPLALAQTRRLLLAKQLLTDTSLRVVDIAFASGFSSVRQFNRMFRQSYRLNPVALRKRRTAEPIEGIVLQLGYRPPLAWRSLIQFLAGRATTSTELLDGDRYIRTARVGKHVGWIAAQPGRNNLLRVEVAPSLLPVLPELLVKLRRLFDLAANPTVIDDYLVAHNKLAAHVTRTAGLRVPGTLSGFELALRAVLGQQITVKAATTVFGRFVDTFGTSIETPFVGISKVAPSSTDVANATLEQLIAPCLTRKRAETVRVMSRSVADN